MINVSYRKGLHIMQSMTGYGRGESILYNRKFVVEIKAVNHRYNDISIKMPRVILSYEDNIRKLIGSRVNRGKVDIYINFETYSKEDINISVNENIAEHYFNALTILKDKFDLREDISLSLMARFPDIITVDKALVNDEAAAEIEECLIQATKTALDNFVDMRLREGQNLKANILEKLDIIYNHTVKINERAPLVAKDYRQRLEDKIKEQQDINVDESRLLAEVLLFADKACIDEEITRLFSHIDQMKDIVNEVNSVGRKLDFLIQEMNREVNTIGSKSNDLIITNIIVETKGELEKIREQIQNIE